MRSTIWKAALFSGMVIGSTTAMATTVTLYEQDFETPASFPNSGIDASIAPVNSLYGNQPPGFVFAQANTVETLLITGTQAFGAGYSDPDGRGGSYALGMLSDVQDDRLGLSFDIGARQFLNFRVDISSIDLSGLGGPFVPAGGAAPTFRFSLFDNPGGAAGTGSGTALSFVDATAPFNPSKSSFLWSTVNTGLSAMGNTNGNVILQIDLLSGGYAAFDNIIITADDVGGGVGGVIPEPSSWAMMISGFGLVGAAARRRRFRFAPSPG